MWFYLGVFVFNIFFGCGHDVELVFGGVVAIEGVT